MPLANSAKRSFASTESSPPAYRNIMERELHCRKGGVKEFRFHELRHTFASHLDIAGVDITTVKELLGHKDIKMTLRFAYTDYIEWS